MLPFNCIIHLLSLGAFQSSQQPTYQLRLIHILIPRFYCGRAGTELYPGIGHWSLTEAQRGQGGFVSSCPRSGLSSLANHVIRISVRRTLSIPPQHASRIYSRFSHFNLQHVLQWLAYWRHSVVNVGSMFTQV